MSNLHCPIDLDGFCIFESIFVPLTFIPYITLSPEVSHVSILHYMRFTKISVLS